MFTLRSTQTTGTFFKRLKVIYNTLRCLKYVGPASCLVDALFLIHLFRSNSLLQIKMKELKDKLDLASYLIKPVQRLGKYALLLRDMIACCDPKDPRVVEMNV